MWFFHESRQRINISNFFLSLAICLLFASCVGDDSEILFSSVQTERLLANDSIKTWILVSREHDDRPVTIEGCALDNELIFFRGSGDAANKLLFDDTCDENNIFDGYWEVPNQNDLLNTDTLLYLFNPDTIINTDDSLLVNHDTLINIIDRITSQFLSISRLDTIDRSLTLIKEDYEVSDN